MDRYNIEDFYLPKDIVNFYDHRSLYKEKKIIDHTEEYYNKYYNEIIKEYNDKEMYRCEDIKNKIDKKITNLTNPRMMTPEECKNYLIEIYDLKNDNVMDL